MANFTNNRYPWPTEDHGGANAETGGNTRLLFAEQDNYRTRKGKKETTSDTTVLTSDVATGDTGYLGHFATDVLASGAASGGSATNGDYYYSTADSQLRFWDAALVTPAWAVVEQGSDIKASGLKTFLKTTAAHAFDNEEDLKEYLSTLTTVLATGENVAYLLDSTKLVDVIAFDADGGSLLTTEAVTAGDSGFLGTHATDALANGAASGDTGVFGDWYYNTTDDLFYMYSASSVIQEALSNEDASSPNPNNQFHDRTRAGLVAYENVKDSSWANSDLVKDALEAGKLDSYANTDVYVFYNEATSSVHHTTGYTESGIISSGANDVFYVIPRVVSADIAETTENIPIEFLKGSLSANKAQAGAQTYGNGFSIAASEEGMHLFLRTLCNSRNDDIIVKTRNDDSDAIPKRDTLANPINHITSDNVADDSTTAVDFNIEIESPSVVQLRVLLKFLEGDNVLELQIDGYDHEGEELREIMLLGFIDSGTTKLTDFYFAAPPEGKKTTYKVNKGGGFGAIIDIRSIDRWTEVTFNQQDSVLLPGWTVEVRKGTIPFTYVGVSPNEASIALSRDTALQMDITTIAFDSLPYTDIEGNRVDLDDGGGSEGVDIEDEKGRGEIDFVDASETLFTGWQAYLDVTEPGTATPVRVPLTDATFSINHQLDQAQLIVGDRRPGPPFRSTLRDVMLDGTILFTRERDWVRLFRNNTDFKNPVVVLRNAPAGGFPYELHIELGLGQLMSSPDPQVSDLGLITQAFNMKFRETMSGMSDDFRFKIVTDKWIFETENNTVGGLRADGIYE